MANNGDLDYEAIPLNFLLNSFEKNLNTLKITDTPSYDWAVIAEMSGVGKEEMLEEIKVLTDLREKGVFTMNDWVEFSELPDDEHTREEWTYNQFAMKTCNTLKEEKDWSSCVPPFCLFQKEKKMVSKELLEKIFGKGCCATMSLADMHIYHMNVLTDTAKDFCAFLENLHALEQILQTLGLH